MKTCDIAKEHIGVANSNDHLLSPSNRSASGTATAKSFVPIEVDLNRRAISKLNSIVRSTRLEEIFAHVEKTFHATRDLAKEQLCESRELGERITENDLNLVVVHNVRVNLLTVALRGSREAEHHDAHRFTAAQ